MRLRSPNIRRRIAALTLAYLLALQGMFVAWTAATVFAAEITGIPAAICASQAAPDSPQGSKGLPACCPCGAFCLLAGCATVGAPGDVFVLVRHAAPVAFGCSVAKSNGPPRFAGAPAQARAPPPAA